MPQYKIRSALVQLLSNILGKRETQKTGNGSANLQHSQDYFPGGKLHFYQHGLYDIFVNDSIINISRNPKKYNIKDNREGILQIQSLVFGINNQQQNYFNTWHI